MSPTDWAGLIVSIIAIASAFLATIRWLVKHYLNELKPNSGTSLKDSVTRLELQVSEIMRILMEKK
jgi:methionine-rich copper-binding protein CopC